MTVLDQIAFFQNRRDEVPNQELARRLAETQDQAGIREIAANLWNKNKNVRSDCLKVLYEIGYINPALIADYVSDFLKLLTDKENRMVWGGMIGLGTIASLRPVEIWQHIDQVLSVIDHGTVITLVWGIKTVAQVAAANPAYRERILPDLLQVLQKCIPRDVPTHAENMLCAIDAEHRDEFLAILNARHSEMSPAQASRLKKVIKQVRAII